MKIIPRDERIWNNFFDETKREWLKVEVFQDYTTEDDSPSLRAWLAGDKQKAIELLKEHAAGNDWIKDVASKTFKKTRIHIVVKPFTSYLEWELECYRHINIPLGGETVCLVPRENISLPLPDGDFHIFDDERVIKNNYQDGRCVSFDIYEKGEDISYFLNLKEELWKHREQLR